MIYEFCITWGRVTSNVAFCVRREGNKQGNIGIVASNVALFVRPEGNKPLTVWSASICGVVSLHRVATLLAKHNKKRSPQWDDLRNLLIDYNLRLAFSDSACRAGSFASTAGYANISIDVVLCIALGNSSNGAAVSASTARYASVRNYICHK